MMGEEAVLRESCALESRADLLAAASRFGEASAMMREANKLRQRVFGKIVDPNELREKTYERLADNSPIRTEA